VSLSRILLMAGAAVGERKKVSKACCTFIAMSNLRARTDLRKHAG
jgi:hypothetical protein